MIYLLRHGEIVQSRPRRFVGQRDLPLTAHGRAQAAWWRQELSGVEFAAIVASDLTRCRETAAVVADGRQVRLDPAWREISLGSWEGLTKQEVQRRYPGQWEARGANLALHQTPGGESFAQVAERALPALEALAALDGPVLVVAHAGVIRAALCRVLEMPLNNLLRLELDYAGLCLLEPGPGHWVLRGLNLRPGV